MKSKPAPVAVFAYNRPDHLESALRSLIECEGADATPITVFIDGPKDEVGAGVTEQVRLVASSMLGSRADIRLAATNQGLSKSIVSGVRQIVEMHGAVIVVEDDLTLASSFLTFMNEALQRYWSDENVYQISGHMFDVPEFADRKEAVFLPFTTTWGWATWRRAWSAYERDPLVATRLRSDRLLRKRFDLGGAYPFTSLMDRQCRGLSDSWGIHWYWSVFEREGRCLFPPQSLVSNDGQDRSGTHGSGIVADFSNKKIQDIAMVPKLPSEVAVHPRDFEAVGRAIWKQNGGWTGWMVNKLRQILGK